MLQVSSVHKRYDDQVVLADVSFIVNPGDRLGLVGPNGCGKTTLLRIIAGQEEPDRGSVRLSPANLRLGYLEQGLTYRADETVGEALHLGEDELAAAEQQLQEVAGALATASEGERSRLEDAYSRALAELEALAAQHSSAHDALAVLAGLGLKDVALETPVATLSGGQKTRLGLARILLARPQVLLLDEPTNHLDIDALEWLEGWLQAYRGAALIVSHDRSLLDRAVNTILELDPRSHTVTAYPGAYDDYLAAKQRELDDQWSAYKDQQERIARVNEDVRRLTNYAGSIERGTTHFHIRKIAKGIARRAVVQRRRLERELDEARVDKPEPTWQMKLEFVDTPESGQDVLILDAVSVGYGGAPLLTGVNQLLRSGERVALIGPNGAGKTTLLRAITGELAPLAGRVRLGAGVHLGYYSQEQENLDPESTPFATIAAVAPLSETDTRSFLHYFLFAGDDVFKPVGSLSYGERARLVLARLVATGCNLLLLDEPINHLDIPSRANFERAMAAFDGTVLAVVHDRYFIRQFASRLWVIEAGTVASYVDLDDWRRGRGG